MSTPSSAMPVAVPPLLHGPGFWKRAFGHRSFAIGAVLTLLLVVAALLSLVWAPHSPTTSTWPRSYSRRTRSTGSAPTRYGRDVLSQLLVGSQASIVVGVVAVSIGLVIGTAFGLLASAKRGWVEEIIMRVADFGFAFPAILSAIMLTAVFGAGMVNSMIAIGIYNIPIFARITRASANTVWAREFVLAARACGKNSFSITLEHVLPNILVRAHRADDDPVRDRHPRRSGPVISRARNAAAAAVLGTHAERSADAHVPGAAAGGLPRRRDRAGGPRAQSAGRRSARPVRSQAGQETLSPPMPLLEVTNLHVTLQTAARARRTRCAT